MSCFPSPIRPSRQAEPHQFHAVGSCLKLIGPELATFPSAVARPAKQHAKAEDAAGSAEQRRWIEVRDRSCSGCEL
ncbi:hypothetical protein M0R45_037760 [Rubus argutus]|uniref:Uncharacterized protein n=1 Tax=Rubus argutus TaxID=59490 RepID=A0AAW1W340_RUBAR